MGKSKKTNSTKIPRTEQDVKRAYQRGFQDAIDASLVLILYTLKDKFGATDDEIKEFSHAYNYIVDSVNKGYVTQADLKTVVKEEYGTTIHYERSPIENE